MGRKVDTPYRPMVYIAAVFTVTWICAAVNAMVSHDVLGAAGDVINFMASASPLLAALLLYRKKWGKSFLLSFIFGKRTSIYCYVTVALLFLLQYLNFYLFRLEGQEAGIQVFLLNFAGQLIFGGALEEGGWRGYLQPALESRLSVLPAAFCVGLVWAFWHLPYFILPGSMHTDGNFLIYIFQAVITGYILTAIHKLTGSILLCTLFHGWQNTIVLTVRADMGNLGFLAMFAALGTVSVFICARYNEKRRK